MPTGKRGTGGAGRGCILYVGEGVLAARAGRAACTSCCSQAFYLPWLASSLPLLNHPAASPAPIVQDAHGDLALPCVHCPACNHKEALAPLPPNPCNPTPIYMQDVRADPTLPRTRDVRCPSCNHQEAVFFSASSEQGMTLYFNCMGCAHRWRDYV